MPAYKKQHYLPTTYLGTFAKASSLPARERSIFRVGANAHGFVPVESQCQKPYFYSQSHPQEVEEYFQKVEDIYTLSIPRIQEGYELSKAQLFNLLLFAADLYARNWKFRVQNEDENFQHYLKRTEVLKNIVLPSNNSDLSDLQKRDLILNTWDFRVINFHSENALLTCDCPTHYLGSSKMGDRLKAILLPLTPNACFVAADATTYAIEDRAGSDADAIALNMELIRNANHSVYSTEELSGLEIETVQKVLPTESHIPQDGTGWALHLIDYDKKPNLSFLKSRKEH